jgi:biopolymer transport protein ExbB
MIRFDSGESDSTGKKERDLKAMMFNRQHLEILQAMLCSLLLLFFVFGAVSALTISTPLVASAQDTDEEGASEKDESSVLGWMFSALGYGYSIIFLALSFTLVSLFIMNLLMARRDNIVPEELVENFEACLDEKQYQEAYDLAKSDESFLGLVLTAGLGKLSAGYAQSIEAMQEVGEEESMKLEHRLSYLALIGTVAPMLGLFGTVDGMIRAFRVIATSDSTPKPQELAAGISTALFTTLVGLAIAIPAISAYNIMRNRISRLVLEVGIISEGLMGRFQSLGKKKPAAAQQ